MVRSSWPRKRSRGTWLLLGIVAALGGLVALPGIAQADIPDTPSPAWMTNGPVYALAQAGGVVYIGGKFTQLMSDAAGTQTLAVSNLAAVDAVTGQPVTSWDPVATNPNNPTNATVYALAVSPDGQTIYAGGAFTTVGGVTHNRLVAIGADGTVDPWQPSVGQPVRALATTGSMLYLGGDFTTVDGQSRTKLAAYDLTTGTLSSTWKPSVSVLSYQNSTNTENVRVKTLAVDGSGKVVIGGNFVNINGIARRALGRVDGTSGALDTAWTPDVVWQTVASQEVFGVVVTPGDVYAAVGGSKNYTAAYASTKGSLDWRTSADGDVQTITSFRGQLIIGGHFTSTGGALHTRLARLSPSTGAVDSTWNPSLTGNYYGAWALTTDADISLFVGGQFSKVTGVGRTNLAKFADLDTTKPTAPSHLIATAISASQVDMTWTGSTDDVAVASYRIYRDGVTVGQVSAPTTQFSDTSVGPSQRYTYTVTAVDSSGNQSDPSNGSQVTMPASTAPIHQDDFESGDLSKWTSTGGPAGAMTVGSDVTYDGVYAVRAVSPAPTTTSNTAFVYKDLPGDYAELYWTAWFDPVSIGSQKVNIGQLANGSTGILTVFVKNGTLGIRNNGGATQADTVSTRSVSIGTWHRVDVHVLVNGSTSSVDVSLDGSNIAALTKAGTIDLGSLPINRFYLGDRGTTDLFDVAFDDHQLGQQPAP
jgi:chitodextrinase